MSRINWSSPLARRLSILYVPECGPFELVSRVALVRAGDPTYVPGRAAWGKSPTVVQATPNTATRNGWSMPQLGSGPMPWEPTAPPITLFGIGVADQNAMDVCIRRGNGSGEPAFGVGMHSGSFSGGDGSVRTTGGTLNLGPASFIIDAREPLAVVLTIGVTTTTLYAGRPGFAPVHITSGSTPTGDFFYEYSAGDFGRTLAFGARDPSANIAMGGAVYGEEWPEVLAREFIRDPWQLLVSQSRRIWVPTVAAAPTGTARITMLPMIPGGWGRR